MRSVNISGYKKTTPNVWIASYLERGLALLEDRTILAAVDRTGPGEELGIATADNPDTCEIYHSPTDKVTVSKSTMLRGRQTKDQYYGPSTLYALQPGEAIDVYVTLFLESQYLPTEIGCLFISHRTSMSLLDDQVMRYGTATPCCLFVSSAYASIRSTKCRAADSADPVEEAVEKMCRVCHKPIARLYLMRREKAKIDTLASVTSQVVFHSSHRVASLH